MFDSKRYNGVVVAWCLFVVAWCLFVLSMGVFVMSESVVDRLSRIQVELSVLRRELQDLSNAFEFHFGERVKSLEEEREEAFLYVRMADPDGLKLCGDDVYEEVEE